MVWYILGAIVALAIHMAASAVFANIAEEKGYSQSGALWICILFGTIGYIWVAALPDAILHEKISNLGRNQYNSTITSGADTPGTESTSVVARATFTEDGRWICGNCQTANSMNYGQCKKCGKFRS